MVKADVVAAVQDHLAFGFVHEAVPGARGDGVERRAQVHPGLRAQHHGLARGDEVDEGEHVGDDLGHRGLFYAPEVNDATAHGLQGGLVRGGQFRRSAPPAR